MNVGDLINTVTERSGLDDFPTNAERLLESSSRYLNKRLRLNSMLTTDQGTTDADGYLAFDWATENRAESNVIELYQVVAGANRLRRISQVEKARRYEGYIEHEEARGFTTTAPETDIEYSYYRKIKHPMREQTGFYDLFAVDPELFVEAGLLHALIDAGRPQELEGVSALLVGQIEALNLNDEFERYGSRSMHGRLGP